jgi:Winged helix DNA-binding domain
MLSAMFDLDQLRRSKWHLDGRPVRTLDEAREFIEAVGFCQMYPLKTPVLAPTFIGAWVGSDERLPTWQHAYSDPRAQQATELMVRLLRERAAYEANLFDDNSGLLVAASVFPYFYALVGDRNPKQILLAGARSEYSQLVCDAFEIIRRDGPISKHKLLEAVGGGTSAPALDKSLAELWSRLRITRVDYKPGEGAVWDVLYRWSPDAVHEGISLSVAEALSALISKYLDCVVAADQQELEAFFGNFVPRSRIKEAINTLLAARELSFVHVGNRSLIQITPEKSPTVTPLVRHPEPAKRQAPVRRRLVERKH